MAQDTLTALRQKLGEAADLQHAAALLQWDQEVNMPPKGAAARGQQLATVSALRHRLFTSPEMGALIEDAREAELSPADQKLVEVTAYDYDRARKLPEAFVHDFTAARSRAYHAWVEARQQSDFAAFEPHLAEMVRFNREKAEHLGYEGSPYNALLENYERGMTVDRLTPIFEALAPRQRELVQRIVNAPRQPDISWLKGTWDTKRQWDLSIRVLRDIGYDFEAGRQDRSVHPFTTSFDPGDVRITTRLNAADPFSGLMGSLHEGGHALYEQGVAHEDRRTPLASGTSLGIHESQSRMWENVVGRSLPFWECYAPTLHEAFPERLEGVTAEQIHAAVNRVRPSLIRVEADECTYNLHIILRYEIELDLIEGRIAVEDTPAVWNEKMRDYLGLDAPDDAQGCLQDIHWSHGAMGYFPTYALGNLYAAQFLEVIEERIPGLWSHVREGAFAPLLQWLREHIHRHGRRHTALELIENICGGEPSSGPYMRYLETKYGALYAL